ncbi:hypothetical protein IF2G_08526 [Cordyceps javanica]|nr:hypothetical protein IF2G_08526 [Cordyceps javanica]
MKRKVLPFVATKDQNKGNHRMPSSACYIQFSAGHSSLSRHQTLQKPMGSPGGFLLHTLHKIQLL